MITSLITINAAPVVTHQVKVQKETVIIILLTLQTDLQVNLQITLSSAANLPDCKVWILPVLLHYKLLPCRHNYFMVLEVALAPALVVLVGREGLARATPTHNLTK